jgi:L-threonylcarbamoyladenylate synthase
MDWNNENLIKILKKGDVAIMPTDTIYGIVGQALNISTVNKIYKLKKRNPEKPCIILIGDIGELEKFSITLSEEQKNKLNEYWFTLSKAEGPVSIIFDCPLEEFSYLHRGTNTLAFRLSAQTGLPKERELQNLLIEVGPLIAPSANPEGLSPAKNIAEAKQYFGNSIGFYLDGGEIIGKASKVIKLHKDGSKTILRA